MGLGIEGGECGEETVVDCWDDGEEGDWLLFGRLVGGKEGGGEALPDRGGIEGEHEFDGRAREKGGEKGVHGPVDMVQGEDVQEVV